MASSKRMYKDRSGRVFIPMNVEGGSWSEHFVTTPKLLCLGGCIFALIVLIMYLNSRYASLTAYIIYLGAYLFISQLLIRYVVFEEKMYYKMYKDMEKDEITTPAIFWDIATIKDTQDGAILTYSDAKIGVIVKLERDTITGKSEEFMEQHYDAVSDFYKEIMQNKYSFVKMNIMETAENDDRLDELDKIASKSDNINIKKLIESEVGYIKNITQNTLYETEYILIYTNDSTKIDKIISDSVNMVYKILNGAYIGYSIMSLKDIIEFVKEEYGVKYFNYTEAAQSVFKSMGMQAKKPFKLKKLVFSNGDEIKVKKEELNIINKITSECINNSSDINKIALKKALDINNDEFNDVEIVFDDIVDNKIAEKTNKKHVRLFTNKVKNDNIEAEGKNKSKKLIKNKAKKLGEHSRDSFGLNNISKEDKKQQNYSDNMVDFDLSSDSDEKIDF